MPPEVQDVITKLKQGFPKFKTTAAYSTEHLSPLIASEFRSTTESFGNVADGSEDRIDGSGTTEGEVHSSVTSSTISSSSQNSVDSKEPHMNIKETAQPSDLIEVHTKFASATAASTEGEGGNDEKNGLRASEETSSAAASSVNFLKEESVTESVEPLENLSTTLPNRSSESAMRV